MHPIGKIPKIYRVITDGMLVAARAALGLNLDWIWWKKTLSESLARTDPQPCFIFLVMGPSISKTFFLFLRSLGLNKWPSSLWRLWINREPCGVLLPTWKRRWRLKVQMCKRRFKWLPLVLLWSSTPEVVWGMIWGQTESYLRNPLKHPTQVPEPQWILAKIRP